MFRKNIPFLRVPIAAAGCPKKITLLPLHLSADLHHIALWQRHSRGTFSHGGKPVNLVGCIVCLNLGAFGIPRMFFLESMMSVVMCIYLYIYI